CTGAFSMGDRSVVINAAKTVDIDTTHNLICDQVIFTSLRSSTSQGYRIVAASPSVRHDEKDEITRRSPSHESLFSCEGDPCGLLVYELSSGRYCIAYSCHAGREQSSRGGQRVYTHMVLLNREDYQHFDYDPVRIHALLSSLFTQQGPLLKAPRRLEPLSLPLNGFETLPMGLSARTEWIWAVANGLLENQKIMLVGATEPLPLLQWALLSLPLCLRRRIDISVGIKFSSNRQTQLILLPVDKDIKPRVVAERNIKLWRADSELPCFAGLFETWFKLLQRWWNQNRLAEIIHLTSKVCADAPLDALPRIAAICEDLDRVKTADADLLEKLVGSYAAMDIETPAEANLIKQLIDISNQRLLDMERETVNLE
ncbi:MAG: hypothetical protein JSV03_08150, partial [Planctomycetota bacterium]